MIFKVTKHLIESRVPSNFQMAKNLISTAKNIATRMVTDGGVLASGIEIDERNAICSRCSFLVSAENKCKLCGCNLSVKVRFAASKCPISNWPEI